MPQAVTNLYDRITYNALRVVPNLSLHLTPKLRTIAMEITNNCNLNCEMCHIHDLKRGYGYMDIRLYRKILNQAVKLKPTTLHLNFEGESFLHPKIREFLRLGYLSGIPRRVLFTNGMMVKPHLEAIAKYLTKITFSLDGIGEVNDKIRVGCNYDTVIENIEELKLIREKLGSTLKIGANLTNYTQTPEQIHDFMTEMLQIVDTVSVAEYRDQKNQYTKSGYDLRHIKDANDRRTVRPTRYCAFPLNTIVVLWDGSISFCMCAVTSHPPLLSDFNAYTDDLAEVWKSDQWKQMRNDAFRLGYPPYKECVTCEFRKQLR